MAGAVDDPERTASSGDPARRGAQGHFAWSLLDNFEWVYGYDRRFGLVHVDYATRQRTIKTPGRRCADLIRTHAAHGEEESVAS